MSRATRLTSRLRIETLEDRITPSWTGVPPLHITPPLVYTEVTLNTNGDASGTDAITNDEIDWYKVTVPAGGGVTFRAGNALGNLDTVIGIYNAAGKRLGYNDDFLFPSDLGSQVTLSLGAGTYYFGATNYTGTPGGAYSWLIDAPGSGNGGGGGGGGTVPDDTYENNDTRTTASNLGNITADQTINNLIMADSGDWYRFVTVGTGTSTSKVTINFLQSQGDLDLRLYNSIGKVLRTSQGSGDSDSVSLNGLAAGTYYVLVTGFNGASNPNYSMSIVPPAAPPGSTTFDITLRITGMTPSQQAIFQQAADRWEQVITGDLPNASYQGMSVDDVLIDASGVAIDGPGGILGQAGPDRFRAITSLPYHGRMQFDTDDLAMLEASGQLVDVILHEMGHVLGIGTLWSTRGFLSGAGTVNPTFTGPQATAAYNQVFGTNATGVPVENSGGAGTRDSHWRESIFDNELMTGYLNSGVANPLSIVTIASLADLGYTVDMSAADNYP